VAIALVKRVWELALTSGQQSILLAMADHAHDDGSGCYPGVRLLAWKTGRSGRAVQTILKELRDLHIIQPVAHAHGGRGRSTEYALHLDLAEQKTPLKGAASASFKKHKGEESAPITTERVKNSVPPPPIKGEAGFTPTFPSSPPPKTEPSLREECAEIEDSDWFKELKDFKLFQTPTLTIAKWMRAHPDTSMDDLESTLVSMKSRLSWNEKRGQHQYYSAAGQLRYYSDPWATLRTWVVRDQPPQNGQRPRSTRVEARTHKEWNERESW